MSFEATDGDVASSLDRKRYDETFVLFCNTLARYVSLSFSLSVLHIFIPIFVVCPPRFCSTFLKSTDNNILTYYVTHVLL